MHSKGADEDQRLRSGSAFSREERCRLAALLDEMERWYSTSRLYSDPHACKEAGMLTWPALETCTGRPEPNRRSSQSCSINDTTSNCKNCRRDGQGRPAWSGAAGQPAPAASSHLYAVTGIHRMHACCCLPMQATEKVRRPLALLPAAALAAACCLSATAGPWPSVKQANTHEHELVVSLSDFDTGKVGTMGCCCQLQAQRSARTPGSTRFVALNQALAKRIPQAKAFRLPCRASCGWTPSWLPGCRLPAGRACRPPSRRAWLWSMGGRRWVRAGRPRQYSGTAPLPARPYHNANAGRCWQQRAVIRAVPTVQACVEGL